MIFKNRLLLMIAIFVFVVVASMLPLFQPVDTVGSEDPDAPEMKAWLDETPPKYEEPVGGWVYGNLKYPHDIRETDEFHMELLAHPKSKVPDVIGAFAFTDVGVNVRLRGVERIRALHKAEELHRPHEWRARERERWDSAMQYVWGVSRATHTFRVHNLEKLDDRTVEADVEFLLGGAWHDLAYYMVKDEYVRPIGNTDTEWDSGSKEHGLFNPNIPK